jgi:O-antigen/teichoic acid export membrane protein
MREAIRVRMTGVLQTIKYNINQGKTLLTFGFLQAVGQALGMIAPLVIAGFFSKDLFGRYSLAWMVVFFFVSLLSTASQAPFIVYANQEREETGRINRSFTIQAWFLAGGTAVFLLLMLAFGKLVMVYAGITATELVFACIAYLGLTIKTFLGNLFMALGQRVRSAVLELVFGLFTLIPIVALCLTDRITMSTAFSAHGLAGFLATLCLLTAVDFRPILPFEFDRARLKAMLTYTLWLMIGSVAAYLINWGDNFVLRYYVSMDDIGVYNLAYRIFKGVAMLVMVVYTYFLPFVSQYIDDIEKMRAYLHNKRPKILALGLACIGLLFVMASILRPIYGKDYFDAVLFLRVLLIGSALILYVVFYETILYARKSYRFIQVVNVIQFIINVGLDILLVPRVGPLGAAVATVLAYFGRVVIIEAYFRMKIGPSLHS